MISQDLPEKITKGALTNNTKLLRAIANSADSFAIPLTQKLLGQTGLMGSLGSSLSFLERENIPLTRVLNIRNFNTDFAEIINSDNDEAVLITIGDKPGSKAAGLVFYRGHLTERFEQYAQSYTNGSEKFMRETLPVVAGDLNIDHPETQRVLSRELRGQYALINDQIESGGVATAKEADIAVLSRDWGLKLKACMFPGNGNIIQDVNASHINQRFNTLSKDIEDGKHWARIILSDRWGNKENRDSIVVPSYAIEFLELDEDGIITGTKPHNSLRVKFKMKAEIDTDFTDKTRFRLNSDERGKLTLLERALKQHRNQIRPVINLQGKEHSIKELNRERRLCGTHGHIKFNSEIGISFTLHASGMIDNLVIGNGSKNSLTKAAMSMPENVSMVFRGRNYSLEIL